MMTAAVLREMAAAAAKRAGVCCMIDVKPQLYWLELSEEDGIFDAAIAAYLINPLKDSYTYDGIAQDFLGMTVPSRADWMKKMTLTEASEKEKESFGHYLAYSAKIPVQAYGTLKKRLEETGMDRLFDEIEMPLVYALYVWRRQVLLLRRTPLQNTAAD